MARKVTLHLTLSDDVLWWSADGGVNWAQVGPKSPVTILQKGGEIQWVCDNDTIEDIHIKIDSGDVIHPPTGSKKDKTSKLNHKCCNKSSTKYTITAHGKVKVIADPLVKYCEPPCAPGGDG